MTTREQEQMVAQWMGWTYRKALHADRMVWESPSGHDIQYYPPAYGANANAWPQVFAELERRGLIRTHPQAEAMRAKLEGMVQ